MEGRDFVVVITIAPNVRRGGYEGVTGDRDSGEFSSAWRRARGVAKWRSCGKYVDGGERRGVNTTERVPLPLVVHV